MQAWEKLIKIAIHIPIMSSVEPLREVVHRLADTFNDPQNRKLSYFDFYDDSLIIHGSPPNLPANKEGFKQFIYLLWKAFPNTFSQSIPRKTVVNSLVQR